MDFAQLGWGEEEEPLPYGIYVLPVSHGHVIRIRSMDLSDIYSIGDERWEICWRGICGDRQERRFNSMAQGTEFLERLKREAQIVNHDGWLRIDRKDLEPHWLLNYRHPGKD